MNSKWMFLTLVIVYISCSKNDKATDISGSWQLTKAYGTIASITRDYDEKEVIWNFMSNGKLTVTNNYTKEWDISPQTGEYDYTVVKDTLTARIGIDKYLIEMSDQGKRMVLSDYLWGTDGYTFTLER